MVYRPKRQRSKFPPSDIEGEEWREIAYIGGTHLVSNHGRVWSVYRLSVDGSRWIGGIIIEPHPAAAKIGGKYEGTLSVSRSLFRRVCSNGRFIYTLAHLIYDTFIGPVPHGYVADHKNGDKTDCRVENLFVRPIDYDRGGAVKPKRHNSDDD